MQDLGDLFMKGDLKRAAEFYSNPVVVYMGTEVFVERTPLDTEEALADRRAGAIAVNATSVRVEIDSISASEGGRSDVLVRRHYQNPAGDVVHVSVVRYFCKPVDGPRGWGIEMVELIEGNFPRYQRAKIPERKN